MSKRIALSFSALIIAVSCGVYHWEYVSLRSIEELDFGTPPVAGSFNGLQTHFFEDPNIPEDAAASLSVLTLTIGSSSSATDLKWLGTVTIETLDSEDGITWIEIATYDVGAEDLTGVTSVALDVTPDVDIAPELRQPLGGALVRFSLTGTADGSTNYTLEGEFIFSVSIDM